ncbi:MAG: LssY C-terminal domain-containing protein [Bryobacteraceae bacterium]
MICYCEGRQAKACPAKGCQKLGLLPILLLPVLAMAQQAPVGTEISIRLKSAVSTRSSKPADPVEAVIIVPVVANGRTVIAAGAVVRGTAEKVAQPSAAGERAALLLCFTELEASGARRAIVGRVESVDNARETVDDQGQINGILASETMTGRLDAWLSRLSDEYTGLAGILSAAKNAVFQQASTDISYLPGVEMTLRLAEPLDPPPGKTAPSSAGARPIAGRAALAQLVSRQPFQTVAQRPPEPSDITNLLLVGTEDTLRRAFAEAGWSGAASLNPLSKLETLRALGEDRGYSEAPVSVLLLDGKPPDLVFEKTNNTFARRHHLRIWRRPGSFRGKPVWAVAATHDIGIDLSEAERTFIHRIDSQIDRERDKVVDDLLFTGHVERFDLVERPAVPRQGRNSTGDSLETDGRIAVLLLH